MTASRSSGAGEAHQGPSRQRGFRILAVGVPTLLGVALLVGVAMSRGMLEIHLAEGVVQFRDPSKMMYAFNYEASGHVVLYDEKLGWRNPPNLIGRTFEHPLRINANGLRGRAHGFAKPSGTERVLVLGDSYTWGFDVGDGEVFSEILEQRLGRTRKRTPSRSSTPGFRVGGPIRSICSSWTKACATNPTSWCWPSTS
jgi:hypothetical protein